MNHGFEHIIQQTELGKKAVEEMRSQTQNFENLMQEMVKKFPNEHKDTVNKVRVMSIQALNLAKQGKGDEAQQIIKDFQKDLENGGKNK